MLFDLDLKVIIRNLLEGLIRIPNKTKKNLNYVLIVISFNNYNVAII